MHYEGFTKLFLRLLVVITVLGSSLVAVSRDLGDEFSFSSPDGPWWSRRASMRQGQVEAVLLARLPETERAQADSLSRQIVRLCQKLDFEPAFVLALMDVESGFRPQAVSPVGAVGL